MLKRSPLNGMSEHQITIRNTDFVKVPNGEVVVSVYLTPVSVRDWFTDRILKDKDTLTQAAIAEFVQTMHDVSIFKQLQSAIREPYNAVPEASPEAQM